MMTSSKSLPASSALALYRSAAPSCHSSRLSTFSMANTKWSSSSVACAAITSTMAASSLSLRTRSMSLVARPADSKRKSRASAPFKTHRSGADAERRARSRSNTTVLRSRASERPIS